MKKIIAAAALAAVLAGCASSIPKTADTGITESELFYRLGRPVSTYSTSAENEVVYQFSDGVLYGRPVKYVLVRDGKVVETSSHIIVK